MVAQCRTQTHRGQRGGALDQNIIATTRLLAPRRLPQVKQPNRTVLAAAEKRTVFVGQWQHLVRRVIVAIEHVQLIGIGCRCRKISVQDGSIARARNHSLVIGLRHEFRTEDVGTVSGDMLDQFLARERICDGDRLVIGAAQEESPRVVPCDRVHASAMHVQRFVQRQALNEGFAICKGIEELL